MPLNRSVIGLCEWQWPQQSQDRGRAAAAVAVAGRTAATAVEGPNPARGPSLRYVEQLSFGENVIPDLPPCDSFMQ